MKLLVKMALYRGHLSDVTAPHSLRCLLSLFYLLNVASWVRFNKFSWIFGRLLKLFLVFCRVLLPEYDLFNSIYVWKMCNNFLLLIPVFIVQVIFNRTIPCVRLVQRLGMISRFFWALVSESCCSVSENPEQSKNSYAWKMSFWIFESNLTFATWVLERLQSVAINS